MSASQYTPSQPQAARANPEDFLLLQVTGAVFSSLDGLLETRPAYRRAAVWERLSAPERFISFAVPWVDDQNRVRVSRGYLAVFAACLGGGGSGLCFRDGLTAGRVKCLAFLRLLENSLFRPAAGLFCGADCDPARLSDGESMRFCQSFITALLRAAPQLPALETGGPALARRERGYLSGAYQALGGRPCGGAEDEARTPRRLPPQQAAGYGLCYFAQNALRALGQARLDGKTVLLCGSGGMAPYAAEKAAQLGARIVAVSDGAGCLSAARVGLSVIKDMERTPHKPLAEYAGALPEGRYRPWPGGIWDIPADICLLCSPERPLERADAERLLAHQPEGVFEGVSLACAPEAASLLAGEKCLFCPAVAAGAGGTAAAWDGGYHSVWEADKALRTAMKALFRAVWEKYPGDPLRGAYIAAVQNAADALLRQGVI